MPLLAEAESVPAKFNPPAVAVIGFGGAAPADALPFAPGAAPVMDEAIVPSPAEPSSESNDCNGVDAAKEVTPVALSVPEARPAEVLVPLAALVFAPIAHGCVLLPGCWLWFQIRKPRTSGLSEG